MEWPILTEILARPGEEAERATGSDGAFFVKSPDAAEPLGIIACGENAMPPPPPLDTRAALARRAALFSSAAFALLLAGSAARFQAASDNGRGVTAAEAAAAAAPVISLPPPDLLRPLSPQEAAKENADRPFVDRSDTPASRFVLHASADSRERALTCLTQAVYYEAASEGVDGGRAVAQVVLNRMRHPGYPASVCGVVYQGSDRGTGCQFTFTCDGSLLRAPADSLWTRSRKIAEEALAGRVYAPVGHATSYHADYVLPYWADSLDKSVQIGRHIFYRLRGMYGDRQSFFQRYAGVEPQLPDPRPAVVLPPSADTAQLATALISDGLDGRPGEVEKAAGPATPLVIDATPSQLLADEQAPPVATHRTKDARDCKAASDAKQIAPLGANDMRSGVNSPDC
jgi:spore germination cell wall hydrolase CwlJ-like protein